MTVFFVHLLNFVLLHGVSHLTYTLNLALHSRIQVKKSDAIHKQIVCSCFCDKCFKMKLVAEESQTANQFNPWKQEILFEKQSNTN
jgi:hypothetical protein